MRFTNPASENSGAGGNLSNFDSYHLLLKMVYNSSRVLLADWRIGCKPAIPLPLGASDKRHKFDKRTTGVLNIGGGVMICSTRVCESRSLRTSSNGASRPEHWTIVYLL